MSRPLLHRLTTLVLLAVFMSSGCGSMPGTGFTPLSEEASARLQERYEEAAAKAEALCLEVPDLLVEDVLAGMKGWEDGVNHGSPGVRLMIDRVFMHALRAGQDDHYVVVRWRVPLYQATSGGTVLLVLGSLDTPEFIGWAEFAHWGETGGPRNPTLFPPEPAIEPLVSPDPLHGCRTAKGPFPTSLLGGCHESNDPWCTTPDLNPTWGRTGRPTTTTQPHFRTTTPP